MLALRGLRLGIRIVVLQGKHLAIVSAAGALWLRECAAARIRADS